MPDHFLGRWCAGTGCWHSARQHASASSGPTSTISTSDPESSSAAWVPASAWDAAPTKGQAGGALATSEHVVGIDAAAGVICPCAGAEGAGGRDAGAEMEGIDGGGGANSVDRGTSCGGGAAFGAARSRTGAGMGTGTFSCMGCAGSRRAAWGAADGRDWASPRRVVDDKLVVRADMHARDPSAAPGAAPLAASLPHPV